MFCLVSVVLISCISICQAEWFSSVGQMEDLVSDELDLLKSLDEYILSERNKLDTVKRLAENIRQASAMLDSDVDHYLRHPINQYRLVKRFVKEWPSIEDLVKDDFSSGFLKNFSTKRKRFPNEGDVKGSIRAIMRLQDMYELDTGDLVKGTIKGFRPSQNLSVVDCFDIGRIASLDKEYDQCVSWMNEVLLKDDIQTLSKKDVLDHLTNCAKEQDAVLHSRKNTSGIVVPNLFNKTIKDSISKYRHQLSDGNLKVNNSDVEFTQQNISETKGMRLYKRLCQNDYSASLPQFTKMKKVEKKLKCIYWTNNNHPLLVLKPAKLEELWPSPHIVRFLNILSDREIAHIKSIAKPKLSRSKVFDGSTGGGQSANYRISKSAWFEDWEDVIIESLSQRISSLTGLSMVTAEDLQVANYGVGGQYEPHYDFMGPKDVTSKVEFGGNRIATLLIYLSDVDHGGGTAFIEPKITVRPIKGSAVFWYNLYPSGEGDLRTLHAGCPVLVGVKWIANKWFRAEDQELRRKCGKKRTADNRIF